MKIHQVSLFAENKPGRIVSPVRLMAEQKIDIKSLFLADTEQFGVLRMIVSDWRRAAALLEEAGFLVKVTEVIAVEVADQPGGLADVLVALDGGAINVEYMYAFPIASHDRAILIFRFNSPDAAIERLQAAGFNLLAPSELLEK
jgi:hypothetical protein